MVMEGHGPSAQLMADYVLTNFPVLYKDALSESVAEFSLFERQERVSMLQEDVMSRAMSRWELKKREHILYKRAISQAFLETQALIKTNRHLFSFADSGVAVTMHLLTDEGLLFTGHLGDLKSVMVRVERSVLDSEEGDIRKGMVKASVLTQEHRPGAPKEVKRIKKRGGEVRLGPRGLAVYRKNEDQPGLHITRSLGDE